MTSYDVASNTWQTLERGGGRAAPAPRSANAGVKRNSVERGYHSHNDQRDSREYRGGAYQNTLSSYQPIKTPCQRGRTGVPLPQRPARLARVPGQSLPDIVHGVRAEAWCLLVHTGAYLSRGPGRKPGAVSYTRKRLSLAFTWPRSKAWCLTVHAEASLRLHLSLRAHIARHVMGCHSTRDFNIRGITWRAISTRL